LSSHPKRGVYSYVFERKLYNHVCFLARTFLPGVRGGAVG
jgi:hypothetical protein